MESRFILSDSWYFDDAVCKDKLLEHFKVKNFAGLGLADYDCGIISAGALLIYLFETQKNSLSNLTHITPYITGKYMLIDSSTRRNRSCAKLYVRSRSVVPFSGFLTKHVLQWAHVRFAKNVEQPLIDKSEINRRLDAVEELKKSGHCP